MITYRVALLALALSSTASFAQRPTELLMPGGVLPSSAASSLDPADRLASSLRLLAQNPYDVTALTLAGESALAVGDANAAISFLARAEEINPASGRIKSSLGSALVQLERPREALRMFQDAVALGLPVHLLAKDRGLAFDLTGEPRRAQADYALALQHGGDDEVSRRMALSFGISGDKDAALRKLEPLIRRNDQAAWRARAMILAMTGDLRGGEKIAEQVAPPGMAAGLSQFMRRLAALGPADRAMAVNFGSMPQSPSVRPASIQLAGGFTPILDRGAALLTPVEAAPAVTSAPPVSLLPKQPPKKANAPRRRPGRDDDQVAIASPATSSGAFPGLPPTGSRTAETAQPKRLGPVDPVRRISQRVSAVDPDTVPESLRPAPIPGLQPAAPTWLKSAAAPLTPPKEASAPAVVAAVAVEPATQASAPLFEVPAAQILKPAPVMQQPQPVIIAAAIAPQAAAPAIATASVTSVAVVQPASASPAAPGFSADVIASSLPVMAAPVVERPVQQPDPVAVVAPQPTPVVAARLGGLIANLELEAESNGGPVLSDEQFHKARLAAKRKADAEALKLSETTKLADEKKRDEEERKRVAASHPARIWVQVATGNNEAGFGRTISKLREQAPDALKGLGSATAPFRATNRILVGPFKSSADARATINKLSKAGVQATPFSSDAGEDVKKLSGK